MINQTREDYLQGITEKYIRQHFVKAGFIVPSNIKIGVGFPSTGGTRSKNKTIGQCWDEKAATDKQFYIFISPTIDDSKEVIAVLIHELVHATVGLKHGHKKPFKQCALAVGLEGKMTATVASEELNSIMTDWLVFAGDYPEGRLQPSNKTKQTTRMIKMQCEPCGYIARTSRKTIEEHGCAICPSCNEQMQEDNPF